MKRHITLLVSEEEERIIRDAIEVYKDYIKEQIETTALISLKEKLIDMEKLTHKISDDFNYIP